MGKPKMAVTGDTHGEEGRFLYPEEAPNKYLKEGDYLFICGDFGYLFNDDFQEHKFMKYMAEELPYTICFVDGNHENFDALERYPVTEWNGGKVHIIKYNSQDVPKIIHLMRGQVFEIADKKIFTFGGGNSIDKYMRQEGKSWWPQEMLTEEEMKEAEKNLERVGWKVDYILTHAAPEDTMSLFYKDHEDEKPLNNFLEYIREKTEYEHWWFGHLHEEKELLRNQTALWFSTRNMEDNSVMEV